MNSVRSLSRYSTEAVLYQTRLLQLRELLSVMYEGLRLRGDFVVPGPDGFLMEDCGPPMMILDRGHSEVDVRQQVFVSFPDGWTSAMQEVFMALQVSRTSDRWVSAAALSEWTGLSFYEVVESLCILSSDSRVRTEDGVLWKCF
jgi:hypothetical protein